MTIVVPFVGVKDCCLLYYWVRGQVEEHRHRQDYLPRIFASASGSMIFHASEWLAAVMPKLKVNVLLVRVKLNENLKLGWLTASLNWWI